MNEIDKITKEVPSSITDIKPVPATVQYDQLLKDLATCYKFSTEEIIKFREGLQLEKNKNSTTLKFFLDTFNNILDNSKVDTPDKNAEAIFLQNKKLLKDLVNGLFATMRNYSVNDNELKIVLLGKVIQSLHDGRY